MQGNKQYYDPEMDSSAHEHVLKPIIFRPLMNIKTGKFFSYSYAVAERNQSSNNDQDIAWVTEAPAETQTKINALRKAHEYARDLRDALRQAVKDKDKSGQRRLKREIKAHTRAIEEIIYPEKDRVYVESKEAKRFRLEQQNELTLDAGTIAALQSGIQPAAGSTSDDSVEKIKIALQMQKMSDKIAELEAAAATAAAAAAAAAAPVPVTTSPVPPPPPPKKKAAVKKA